MLSLSPFDEVRVAAARDRAELYADRARLFLGTQGTRPSRDRLQGTSPGVAIGPEFAWR